MRFDNKTAIVSKTYKGHNIRPHSDDGDEEGDTGELTPAREYRYTDILLTKKQFEDLVGKGAYNSFFNTGKKPAEPAFTSFSKLKLEDSYKDCAMKVVFGVAAKEIEVEDDVRVKNISLKLEDTGFASMSCTVVAVFPRNLNTLDFESFLGKEVTLSLRLGSVDEDAKSSQENLPLDDADDEDRKDAAQASTAESRLQ